MSMRPEMRTLTLIALVALVGCSGGEPSEPSEPTTLATNFGEGSSFMCTTERNIMRLEDAIATRNKEKMDLVFEQGCISAKPYVEVKFISGSLSNNTRQVIYEGEAYWAYGGTVTYQTAAELAEG